MNTMNNNVEKPDFLDVILRQKALEVESARISIPESILLDLTKKPRAHRSFFKALSQPGPSGVNIISEIKRASPSKGVIKEGLDPALQASEYEKGGAAAISVLTDAEFFQGSPQDLRAAREASNLPILRKDFIISQYQIYEAALMGADAVLLIARALPLEFIQQAIELCTSLSLDALVEVHSEDELEKASKAGARLIGINNRDLSTFITDIETTVRMSALLGENQIAVGESGIRDRQDIERLLDAGVWNFLIGESLVRSSDPAQMLKSLMGVESYAG